MLRFFWPGEDIITGMTPSAANLIWIDLEMTGLVPEQNRIIEIATIVTDGNLEVLAEGPVIAVHQPDAEFFPRITYLDILNRGLKVMDSTAISLCMENRLPIVVFNAGVRGNLLKVVQGEPVGTFVHGERP